MLLDQVVEQLYPFELHQFLHPVSPRVTIAKHVSDFLLLISSKIESDGFREPLCLWARCVLGFAEKVIIRRSVTVRHWRRSFIILELLDQSRGRAAHSALITRIEDILGYRSDSSMPFA